MPWITTCPLWFSRVSYGPEYEHLKLDLASLEQNVSRRQGGAHAAAAFQHSTAMPQQLALRGFFAGSLIKCEMLIRCGTRNSSYSATVLLHTYVCISIKARAGLTHAIQLCSMAANFRYAKSELAWMADWKGISS